jgi:hypothetical protein
MPIADTPALHVSEYLVECQADNLHRDVAALTPPGAWKLILPGPLLLAFDISQTPTLSESTIPYGTEDFFDYDDYTPPLIPDAVVWGVARLGELPDIEWDE